VLAKAMAAAMPSSQDTSLELLWEECETIRVDDEQRGMMLEEVCNVVFATC
jgi:hypothetical protein